jgi:DNA sulfur modification protein DndC
MATPNKASAFSDLGFKATLEMLKEEIRELYQADDVPWIIGYSGGKDSTAVLQLTWLAIAELPAEQRRKPIHVISTDTMVENPVVAAWVQRSLAALTAKSERSNMPMKPKLLHPRVEESFWVNLIGRGYPAPRPQFRWCTDRLKIKPSNRFIRQVVTDNGEAILLIGARKAESSARARVLSRNQKYRVRERLSPSATLPGCSIYTVIEAWSNDDVWLFLNQVENPWFDNSNKELMGIYAGANPDGECPLVVDTSTPSCGDSRFGCWVCTLVDKDKSMTAMVQNDVEKEWMMPLLDLRNALDFRNNKGPNGEMSDHHLRDFRRMAGGVQLFQGDKPVPGPYTQQTREMWLTKLLAAQTWIRKHGPKDVSTIELISLNELQEIRRIWIVEKHELEDSLPRIYSEATGTPFPGPQLDDNMVLGSDEMDLLFEICGNDRLHFEMARELLSVERQQRMQARRAGLFDRLEKAISRHYYESREDAVAMAKRQAHVREAAAIGVTAPTGGDAELEPAQDPLT